MTELQTHDRKKLAAQAERAGITTSYWDLEGQLHEVGRESLAIVLSALSTTGLAAGHGLAAEHGVLRPVRVSRRDDLPESIEARLEGAGAVEVRWTLELETEDGGAMRDYGTAALDTRGSFRIACTWIPPIGYHRLELVVETGNRRWHGEQKWIVAPDGCWPAEEPLVGDRSFGIMAQLYSLRSDHNWGFGDLGDVTELCRRAATIGADFVALSPLHTLMLRGGEASPYAPSSRIFGNVLVIHIEAIPEFETCTKTAAWLERDEVKLRLEKLRAADQVSYDAVARMKMQMLRRLHRAFIRANRGHDTRRARAYAMYRRERNPLLDAFAVFQTLFDLFYELDGITDWRDWPPEYRNANHAAVRAFAAKHSELLDFQRFLQFELDRQLMLAHTAARAAGLRIGLIHDLAFGSHAGGFDTWAYPELFAGGVELGCPPDPLGPDGQAWGLPPLHPKRLEDDGFEMWIRVVRTAMAHCGGLRVDHVLGLARQFWVPHGSQGREGTYVEVPEDALLGILALESHRSRVLVVGEDLGTAPEGMDKLLAKWQILSTRLVPFVRDHDGGFPAPARHDQRALLLATTHDLPTLAAWWRGEDLDLRRRLDLLSDETWAQAQVSRRAEIKAWVERLLAEGLLPDGLAPTQQAFIEAVHAYMARTPARLVGVWLDDAASERQPANLPGVAADKFRPWRRRLRASIQAIFRDPIALATLRAAARDRV